MANRIARVAVSVTPGGGRKAIIETGNTSVNTGPPVIMGVTALQVLGAFTGTVDVDVPAGASGSVQDVTFLTALSPGIPNSFQLTAGSSGVIQSGCEMVNLPDDPNLVVSCPALSLSFGAGLPTDAGSGTWSLRQGVQYQGPTVNAAVRCYSVKATSETTVTFVVDAWLLGYPATS